MKFSAFTDLKAFLDEQVQKYNQPDFIANDPVSIPHLFASKENIEIMGLWAAIFSWGQRVTILRKCHEIINLMDGNPHQFIIGHSKQDLKVFEKFAHRTFNGEDALYFVRFFQWYFSRHSSLEDAFLVPNNAQEISVKQGLIQFHKLFFSLPEFPFRTRKHISTPESNSACKRLNMFLRWMVRSDSNGVDFGIWKRIAPAQLICPCDVHVERVARELGLLEQNTKGWKAAQELTENFKRLDGNDPVKYDFALFGLGVNGVL